MLVIPEWIYLAKNQHKSCFLCFFWKTVTHWSDITPVFQHPSLEINVTTSAKDNPNPVLFFNCYGTTDCNVPDLTGTLLLFPIHFLFSWHINRAFSLQLWTHRADYDPGDHVWQSSQSSIYHCFQVKNRQTDRFLLHLKKSRKYYFVH